MNPWRSIEPPSRLSRSQHWILLEHVRPSAKHKDVPNGIYRSLVLRGLLKRVPEGYALTDAGRALTYTRTLPD